ncbi:Putative major facilitator superfamily, MFS transporter superfamily [Septoria linicola]|uniref:Major facilitator superfamily, MFS transporter superfamily n=1 Tax=Septoria linicola TaxID=215465 RepID=A0A9Q9EJJ3_9PEZI|nr:putative major facilitator superfamily, MFS transporter superfamily [Septoria linicola]USW52247.1 Putative major facilitator superfamily, MFS transporter superfamily [Septoria linicola]
MPSAPIPAGDSVPMREMSATTASTVNKNKVSTSVASASPRDSQDAPVAKNVLDEKLGYAWTARAWPSWKKWAVLTGMLLVQISQNYNAAVYNSAVPQMQEKFGITAATARLAQMIFLVMYAFGCELWAPFSEEFGRKPMIQASMTLVNIFMIVVAVAPSWSAVFAARALGGLSSAGGSVTLGMVADMYFPEDQFQAVAFTCFGSVVGSVIPPIVGGTVVGRYSGLACIWIAVAIGFFTQIVHACLPETRPEIRLDREAKRMRKLDPNNDIVGPMEAKGTLMQRLNWKHIGELMWRPYWLLFTEPIVLFLSLLSGFSDSLIFSGLDSFGIILSKWNFSAQQVGFAFFGLALGYLIGYGLGALHFALNPGRKVKNNSIPEQRLWLLLWTVLGLPIGLLGWALTSLGPEYGVHWIGALFFVLIIGIANYAIYLHTIDYLVAAYGPFAASATGGNGFCRDFLAGIAAIYTVPMYENIAPNSDWMTVTPTLMLAGIGAVLVGPVYYFFFRGAKLRARSKYATYLERQREQEAANVQAAHGAVVQQET